MSGIGTIIRLGHDRYELVSETPERWRKLDQVEGGTVNRRNVSSPSHQSASSDNFDAVIDI